MIEVDTISVEGNPVDHTVTISFANVGMVIQPELAHELAFALMSESDRAAHRDQGVFDKVRIPK